MRTFKKSPFTPVFLIAAYALSGQAFAQNTTFTNASYEIVADTQPDLQSCETFYSVIPIKELDGTTSNLIFPTNTLQIVEMNLRYRHAGSTEIQVKHLTAESPNMNIRSCTKPYVSFKNVRGPDGLSLYEPEVIIIDGETGSQS